ncbi:MAG: Low molecular weight phosphotyrosine phosphatase [Lasallia pustulata]|nr:MAG: Low molecular weight phosphotyrosine phosphatase [Lasallia pustulata]
MAEAVFRSLTAGNSRISCVDSAGTGAYNTGDSPDPRTLSTLADNGIVDYDHAARTVQSADFAKFDYILAMDRDNLRDLQRMKQRVVKSDADSPQGKVILFGDFGGRKGEAVIDPYYGANDGFDIAYEQMVRFSKGFLTDLLGLGAMD